MAVAKDAVAEAQEAQTDQLRNQLLAALTALYGIGIAADMLTNPAALTQFLGRLVPLSLAVQASVVRSTVQDLASQLPLDRPIMVKPTTIIGAHLRELPMEQVYARTVYSIEDRLDAGADYQAAVDYGLHRLTQTAVTDLQLARTHTSKRYVGELQAILPVKVGTMRVLSSKPSHCALCILASTRVYKADELMPIHPGCGCGTRLVIEDEGTSIAEQVNERWIGELHTIVARDLGDKYVNAGGRGIQDYRHIEVSHEHGELGPILGVRGQHFEGPTEDQRIAA